MFIILRLYPECNENHRQHKFACHAAHHASETTCASVVTGIVHARFDVTAAKVMPCRQARIVPRSPLNRRKPPLRPALRDGVESGDATALSCTFFVPRNPCVPTAPAFSQAPPQTRLTGRDRAVWEAGWGRDATQRGKAAQTASQGQTAGNGQGGPLGPPAACSHRHFRPTALHRLLSGTLCFLCSSLLPGHRILRRLQSPLQ